MEYTFTRKCRWLQLSIYAACGAFGLFYSYLIFPKGALAESILLTTFISILIIAWFALLFSGFTEAYRKITIDNLGITCKSGFKKNHFEWPEISEFKKHEKGIGLWAGFRYYLSSDQAEKKNIKIADNNIENLEQLIDIVFEKAINAKFIKIENQARLPFFKSLQKSVWANRRNA